MSANRYTNIQHKIVSRQDGALRHKIDKDYILVQGNLTHRSVFKKDNEPGPKAPLGIVSTDPMDEEGVYKKWIASNSGFIQEFTSSIGSGGAKQTTFSDVQAFLMDTIEQFVFVDKTRQFGFSYVLAARALSEAMLSLKHTTIFISYNEEESKEKIVYARELYDSLPTKYKLSRKLINDNKTSLVFKKAGIGSSDTRILSYPQRIIRGKGGGVKVRIDEAAHIIHFRKIYTSALPVLSRGDSDLWIGSSPLGKSGLFYEISVNQGNNYPLFVRAHIYWWDIPEFCKDVDTARKVARNMITERRVDAFASERLKNIYNSMLIEDFQQEYECAYLDESLSYFTMDTIMSCVPIVNIDPLEKLGYDSPADHLSAFDKAKSGTGIDFYTEFDDFMRANKQGILSGPYLVGFDVGRTNDASELVFVEETEKEHHQIVRCNVRFKNMRFPEQRSRTVEMIRTARAAGLHLLKLGIDFNGIGMNIAEDLEDEFYDMIVKLPFNSNAWKEDAARKFRLRMEMGGLSLPMDRDIIDQIHSIKRTLLTGSGQWRFDADKNEKHHGDKFWALVAASNVGYDYAGRNAIYQFDSRLFDGKTKKIINPRLPVQPTKRITSEPIIPRFNPYSSLGVRAPMVGMPPPPAMPNFLPQSIHPGRDIQRNR